MDTEIGNHTEAGHTEVELTADTCGGVDTLRNDDEELRNLERCAKLLENSILRLKESKEHLDYSCERCNQSLQAKKESEKQLELREREWEEQQRFCVPAYGLLLTFTDLSDTLRAL